MSSYGGSPARGSYAGQSMRSDYGRPQPFQHDHDKAVDPHNYLLGRERQMAEDKEVWGRRPGDSDQLFPKYTTASAATTGQMTVNGKTLHLWTYSQLETLSQRVLRERAMAIRNAVGEVNCPPMPSSQPQDLVRWIIHMQTEITSETPQVGRAGAVGGTNVVPPSFTKDSQERPICMSGPESPSHRRLPFGPRIGQDHDATRDHYAELVRAGQEPTEEARFGIVSNRKNGEGKRHLFPENNMVAAGVSTADETQANGRKYLGCNDHLMEQKKELEAWERDPRAAALASALHAKGAQRVSEGPVKHVMESHLVQNGLVGEYTDAPIGGERRRHAAVPDRMVNPGVADPGAAELRVGGRKHLDDFAGSKFSQQAQSKGYQSNWKKDPSGLRGTSLIC